MAGDFSGPGFVSMSPDFSCNMVVRILGNANTDCSYILHRATH